jgi:hypothetical protein
LDLVTYDLRRIHMANPPGQGECGQYLMQLWRQYLEQYAEKEGDIESQTIAAAYHAVEVLAALSRTLDRNGRYKELIDQRLSYFHEGSNRAETFVDCLINATFSIYNTLNTLSHQCTEGNAEASALIRKVDEQVHLHIDSDNSAGRPAAALRACFPLLGLIAIALDQHQEMTEAIRQIERRFAAGGKAASSEWERLLNALYRIVEMVQVLALVTDAELKDQVNQIASRFKEEDQARELLLKLRNGFCRLFELGHLLATQVDTMT